MKKKILEVKKLFFGLIPVANAGILDGTGGISGQAKDPDIVTTIVKVINYALVVIGVLAVLVFIYAGFLYLTAGGNETKVNQAKNVLLYAVVGVVVSVLGYVAVATVQRFLVQG